MTAGGRRTALVAGATGALGRRIALRLLEDGWTVIASGRDPARMSALLASAGSRALQRHAWPAPLPGGLDIIVNAAGIGGGTRDVAMLHAANVAVLEPLIAAALANPGCLLVQMSTPATQFRFQDRVGIREDEPFSQPVSPYAASKQAAETLIRQSAGLNWCILRVRAGYGHRAPSMLEDLRVMVRKRALPLVRGGRALIDLVHVDDIAAAVAAVAAARAAMSGITANVAGPQALAFREVVETLASAEGVRPRFIPVPAWLVLTAAGVLESLWRVAGSSRNPPLTRHVAGSLAHSQTLDVGAMQRLTGWRPERRLGDHTDGM
jgi:nucleoside-diphosphate-sugar epimerase